MELIKKYWWISLVLVILAILAWGFPRFKSQERTIATQAQIISDQSKALQTHVKEKVVRVPILLGERVVYKTERVRDTDTSEVSENHVVSDESSYAHEKIVEKRGQVIIGLGLDSKGNISDLLQATVLGPFGIGGYVSFSANPPSVVSGAVYGTVAF